MVALNAELKEKYPLYLAGRPVPGESEIVVHDKYTGEVATRVAAAGAQDIETAIGAAVEAARPMAEMAAYERQAVLMHCVRRFEERQEELARVLCVEAGKPIRDARGEALRLIDTFRTAAEESVRIYGEVMPLDISARARLSRRLAACPGRAVLFHLAFQLSAQPRRPQGRAGVGRRVSFHT